MLMVDMRTTASTAAIGKKMIGDVIMNQNHTSRKGDFWKLVAGILKTRWAGDVSPKRVHAEYPRPTMVRRKWMNLNGLWDYAIQSRSKARPVSWQGQILVPFPVESALSGVGKKLEQDSRLWYRRDFQVSSSWLAHGGRVLLHFGAADWETEVWLNQKKLGVHRGGYDSFSFDITRALSQGGNQELVLAVWDPTDQGPQARGKQVLKPRSIWYTAVSGLWQTVWLEPVPAAHVDRLKIRPDLDHGLIQIQALLKGSRGKEKITTQVLDKGRVVAEQQGPAGKVQKLKIPRPKPWSPEHPHLYQLRITLKQGGRVLDQVESYCGLRKIALQNDKAGIQRLFLNNKPLFQYGPLDQGWWPDGLYSPPSEKAMLWDIRLLKRLGFNMLRKHVKVESERYYYACDKIGMLVWQDMPNSSRNKDAKAKRQFEKELEIMVRNLGNHPSIVMWVPFNEGWGQYDADRIARTVQSLDPTRLVNHASGWTDVGAGDVSDVHHYPDPVAPAVEKNRAAVLGEFGGLGLPVPGHLWKKGQGWGYREFKTKKDLGVAYLRLMEKLPALRKMGLAAAVYTQTTDVEMEANGLVTYDRAVIKLGIPVSRFIEKDFPKTL